MTLLPTWLQSLRVPMPGGLGAAAVYLIHTCHGTALIDTGLNDAVSVRLLETALAERGRVLSDIERVVLTHYHVDHSGLAARLQRSGAEIVMHEIDAEELASFAEHPEADRARAGLFANHSLPDDVRGHAAKMFAFMRGLGAAVRPDRRVGEGDTVRLAGMPFRILHTPGHTPGHLALLQEESGALFTGDTILAAEKTHIQGAVDGDAFQDYCKTLRRLSGLGARIAFSGHGWPMTDIPGNADSILTHLNLSLDGVNGQLREEPKSAVAICRARAGADTRPFSQWLALSQCVSYLSHLVAVGAAHQEETAEGIVFRRAL